MERNTELTKETKNRVHDDRRQGRACVFALGPESRVQDARRQIKSPRVCSVGPASRVHDAKDRAGQGTCMCA